MSVNVNPDLQKERDTCSFEVNELTNIIYGGVENAKKNREIAEIISRDPVLGEGDFHRVYLSYPERYERALQKIVRYVELKKKYNWSDDDQRIMLSLIHFDVGIGVHYIMFMPGLQNMCTDEQRERFLPLARTFQIIGTYAQTELGHGTDVRNLETQADYDKVKQEFVINTPQTSSMKWWPGSLGLSCNHVLLMSQLYIDGVNQGIQPFLVPIRNIQTHEPLPGVDVGEIGPKFSTMTTDNGFLMLKNVRIPRDYMLMRFAEVRPDGSFVKKGADKSNYGTMIFIRSNICGTCWNMLSCAATIATRYSAVRRQTQTRPGEPEPQVLDYQTQQMKLFPSIAASYAILFTHKYMINTYQSIMNEMDSGNFSRLPELHSQAAGFKALSSDIATLGVETVRRSCGGHGYLMSSGLPLLLMDISGSPTYEGENTVLYLQVARYLLKQLTKAQGGEKVVESLHFLNEPLQSRPISDRSSLCMADVDTMMQGFEKRVHYFLLEVGQTIQGDLVAGLQMHEALNRSLVNLVRVAKMYMDSCMIFIFHQSMSNAQCSSELKTILFRVFYFHMVHRIVLNYGEFLESGAFTNDQIRAIKREEIRVLPLLRPDVIGLVDAFNYTDDYLVTTLGRYDGNAYPALLDVAKKSPLNATKVHPAVKKHLLPLIVRSKL